MTVFDLLFLGGGFENSERLNNTLHGKSRFNKKRRELEEFELISFDLGSVLVGEGIAYEKLKMGDKIVVFSKDNILGQVPQTVQISGYIKNPGTYSLTNNMYLTDLFFLGSGLDDSTFSKDMIFDRVDLVRTSPSNDKSILYKIDIEKLINENTNNYLLKPGDRVYVYSKNIFDNLDNEVTISGFVNNPGLYQFYDNMNLGDLILLSGGISGKTRNGCEISRKLNNEDNTQVFNVEFLSDYESFLTIKIRQLVSLFKREIL